MKVNKTRNNTLKARKIKRILFMIKTLAFPDRWIKEDRLIIKTPTIISDPIAHDVTLGFKLKLITRIKLLFAGGIFFILSNGQEDDLKDYFRMPDGSSKPEDMSTETKEYIKAGEAFAEGLKEGLREESEGVVFEGNILLNAVDENIKTYADSFYNYHINRNIDRAINKLREAQPVKIGEFGGRNSGKELSWAIECGIEALEKQRPKKDERY